MTLGLATRMPSVNLTVGAVDARWWGPKPKWNDSRRDLLEEAASAPPRSCAGVSATLSKSHLKMGGLSA